MRYFRLVEDEEDTGEWWLDSPVGEGEGSLGAWSFVCCQRFGYHGKIVVPVGEPGEPRDLSIGSFDVPYLSLHAARVFLEICGGAVQLIDAATTTGERIRILNVLAQSDCLDRGASWLEYDSSGSIHMVLDLKIDKDKARGLDIFRIKDWMIPLMVSERLARAIEESKLTGCSLVPV